MVKRKKGGIGAMGSAFARFFHPSKNIRDQWPNTHDKVRLTEVLITGKGEHRVNRKDQTCYECRIPDIDAGTIFHIVCSNFKVETEGAVPFPSETVPNAPDEPDASPQTVLEDVQRIQELRMSTSDVVSNIGPAADDIAELRNQGIEVDDDNDPAPENAQPSNPVAANGGHWCNPTICPRRANPNIQNTKGNWKTKSWQAIKEMDELALFRMCFPESWVRGSLIPATNECIVGGKMDLQEFYIWLGCQFFMACFEGVSDRRDWWSPAAISMEEGAPFRLNAYLSLKRFNAITSAMRYTSIDPPPFVDRFHDVREMIDAFNDHYSGPDGYSPSWLNCLDESMNSFLNKFCPGFMSVPRKPHPLGNEYHSICDGDGGKPIMWRIKIQEGKDRPKKPDGSWAFPSKFEGTNTKNGQKYTKTSTLMCEMTENIHGTGKIVSMDSGFCVTAGILHMHAHGVFGQSLIKKRKYWPKHVPGDLIDRHFEGKPLGHAETYRQVIDGVTFNVHCTRDDRFVTKMMSTHGLLEPVNDHTTYRQERNGTWVKFNYTEYLSRHNRSKHWVDDVNNRRHDPIGLEQVWHTKWWPTRQFTFICSVAEANAVQSRARARDETPAEQLKFRRALAMKMLKNNIRDDGVNIGSPMRPTKRARLSEVC